VAQATGIVPAKSALATGRAMVQPVAYSTATMIACSLIKV
jgi:hypothetical protein